MRNDPKGKAGSFLRVRNVVLRAAYQAEVDNPSCREHFGCSEDCPGREADRAWGREMLRTLEVEHR